MSANWAKSMKTPEHLYFGNVCSQDRVEAQPAASPQGGSEPEADTVSIRHSTFYKCIEALEGVLVDSTVFHDYPNVVTVRYCAEVLYWVAVHQKQVRKSTLAHSS